jgi:hypothetical protein
MMKGGNAGQDEPAIAPGRTMPDHVRIDADDGASSCNEVLDGGQARGAKPNDADITDGIALEGFKGTPRAIVPEYVVAEMGHCLPRLPRRIVRSSVA